MSCRASQINVERGSSGTFAGGLCRADPGLVDAVIATISIDSTDKAGVVAQSWISELQVAQSQSCGEQIKTGECWCVGPDSCIDAALCTTHFGWRCGPAQDPESSAELQMLLQQQATRTLIEWAKFAGFAMHYVQQVDTETDSEYKRRLVELLVGPLHQGNYDEHGKLTRDDVHSAEYVRITGCPADTYSSSLSRLRTCTSCPPGKHAAAGATQRSDCTMKNASDHPQEGVPATTGTPFPGCLAVDECELIGIDLPDFRELAVLAKQPAIPPLPLPVQVSGGVAYYPDRNHTASGSSTWQVYIPTGRTR